MAGTILVLTALLSACVSSPANKPIELLDQNDGSTLFIAREPIVLARSRTDVAANARDYATLVVVQEDRSGRYMTWLIAHRWSTVDPRFGGSPGTVPSALHLIADDRELTFDPVRPAPRVLDHRRDLYAPRGAQSVAYAADPDTLRFIARARVLRMRYADDPLPIDYTLWRDARAALVDLLTETSP